MDAKAGALDKYGAAEAQVMRAKGNAEAEAVAAKAEAMKKLDGVGKEHEEFKLQLEKRLKVELAEIGIQKDIAAEQAKVLAEALKSAKIDIVGGDGAFFDNLINAITRGKQVDRFVDNSQHVQRIASHLSGDGPKLSRTASSAAASRSSSARPASPAKTSRTSPSPPSSAKPWPSPKTRASSAS